MLGMQRITATTRFWRQLAWGLAAAGFITAALQVAAPLHAKQHLCPSTCSQTQHTPAPQEPEHDADKCSICHYLFGLSGKTLPPHITNDLDPSTIRFVDALCDWQTPAVSPTHRIIPRAPPVT